MGTTKIATGIVEIDIMYPMYGHKPHLADTVDKVKKILTEEVLPIVREKKMNLSVKYKDGKMQLVQNEKVGIFIRRYTKVSAKIERILVTPVIAGG